MKKNHLSKMDEEAIQKAVVGLEELKLLDNGILSKITELEKNIMYRRFYFPGGIPRKLIPGVGVDTDKYRFDNISGERDVLLHWDPRYLDDYLQQEQQNGFHKHFLYFDGKQIVSASYVLARTIIMDKIDFMMGLYLNNFASVSELYKVYGIVGGIEYAGKTENFISEYADVIGITKKGWSLVLIYGDRFISQVIKQIENFVGQTQNEYQTYDFGFMAPDNRKDLWFADNLMEEWEKLQDQYNIYKEKIWAILEKTNVLNLCSNYNMFVGVNLGNISVNQAFECINNITKSEEEVVDVIKKKITKLIKTKIRII